MFLSAASTSSYLLHRGLRRLKYHFKLISIAPTWLWAQHALGMLNMHCECLTCIMKYIFMHTTINHNYNFPWIWYIKHKMNHAKSKRISPYQLKGKRQLKQELRAFGLFHGGASGGSTLRPRLVEQEIQYIDGLVQDCSKPSALAMELLQSCHKPAI